MPRSRPSLRYERLTELLVAARERAGLLQADLAERLGRPQSYVSKNERGERRLDIVEFLEFVEAIGCSYEDILVEVKAIPPQP